jgi:division protein CdvB (Snf7/Vps24/ESCRT-III family)
MSTDHVELLKQRLEVAKATIDAMHLSMAVVEAMHEADDDLRGLVPQIKAALKSITREYIRERMENRSESNEELAHVVCIKEAQRILNILERV